MKNFLEKDLLKLFVFYCCGRERRKRGDIKFENYHYRSKRNVINIKH